MAREKFHTRLDPGDAERLSEYKEDHGIDQDSEALRRLIRRGLEAEGYRRDENRETPARWFARRIGRWADFTMYTAIAFGLIIVTTGLASLTNIGPSGTLGLIYVFSKLAFVVFVGAAGVLSVTAIGLSVYDGMSFKDALPWREPV